MNRLLNRMEYMDHHYEHHFVTNSDNIDHVKAKLDQREQSAEERIDDLEVLIRKVVSSIFMIILVFYFNIIVIFLLKISDFFLI